MTAKRPEGARRGIAARINLSIEPSSSFTSMRIAWNVLVAGCVFMRRASMGEKTLLMHSAKSVVSANGFMPRRAIKARAIFLALSSPPYRNNIFVSDSSSYVLITSAAVIPSP